MLLNEFYNPSATDLKLLGLIAIGRGMLPIDNINGDANLLATKDRLIRLGLIRNNAETLIFTNSGRVVAVQSGLLSGDVATDFAYKSTNASNS